MVLLFLCVLLHEFGHIFTARAFGVSTPDVILLPIGGVSRLERIPEKPSEEFLVAIAGPAVNVVIAVVLDSVFAGAKLGMDSLVSIQNTSAGFIDRLAEVNLFLALFNLIPAFPMDGGRVLRALLAARFGYVRATEIAAAIGQWVAFALGVSRLVRQSVADLHRHFHLSRRLVGGASRGRSRHGAWRAGDSCDADQFAALTPDEHIDTAVETSLQTSQGEFPVVDGMGRPVGLLARNDLMRALKERGPHGRVADAMTGNIPTVNNRRCLDEAVRLLKEKSAPAVAVVDASERLVGLVTSETIGQMLMLHRAQPRRAPRLGRGADLPAHETKMIVAPQPALREFERSRCSRKCANPPPPRVALVRAF